MSESALIIGEALVDVVKRPDGTVETHPGGSPLNVAIGLGRLGRDAGLLTWLGNDDHGALVRAHIATSSVTLLEGSTGAERTSVAAATLDATGAARYDFDLDWRVPAEVSVPAGVIVAHTGSIAAVLEPGATDVMRLIREVREHATVTYDPNARPTLMGNPADARVTIEALVALADVVKVSDEDLEWLLTGDPTDEAAVDALARDWATRGPAFVVVTRGGEGASAFLADGRELSITAPQVKVADTVGAGDSFMGGLIDGLWSAGLLGAERREDLRAIPDPVLTTILDRCARIAGITVSRPGANPPGRAELGES